MQRLCHYFDMQFGGAWGNDSIIPHDNRQRYLISSVIDEAISSSQMEGAATTRKVAKDMLKKKLRPRNKSEQMIFNNFRNIYLNYPALKRYGHIYLPNSSNGSIKPLKI